MNKEQLLKRLNQPEWEDFEVKEAYSSIPKDIWKRVSAFSNSDGGWILFGIKDLGKGKFEINGVSNPEKIQNDFLSTLRGDKFNFQLSSKGNFIELTIK